MIYKYKYALVGLTGIVCLWGNFAVAQTEDISFLRVLTKGDTSNYLVAQAATDSTIKPQVIHQCDDLSETEEIQSSENSGSFFVQKICILHNTVLSSSEIASITQTVEGKYVTLQQLGEVADKITQLYLDKGYITSRAVLLDKKPVNGVFRIFSIEGRIENLEIIGTKRINQSYIRDRIQLAKLNPLKKSELEDQLRLLKANPIFKNVEATLKPGSAFGKNILEVRVVEANAFNAALNFDNYSPPSVGEIRYGVELSYNNLAISGDQIYGSYNRSTTGGANLYDFGYRVPLNSMNGSLQLRTAIKDYRITDAKTLASYDLENENVQGKSELYEINYRQPLIRSPKEEFALSLGFALRNSPRYFAVTPDTDFAIPDINNNDVSRTSVFKFGQEYIKRDKLGAWMGRSQFSLGSNSRVNAPNISDEGCFSEAQGRFVSCFDRTQGQFVSWLAQAQRLQKLGNDNLLIARLDLQLTPNSLLFSDKFALGGGKTLRGYQQNALYGDNGVYFSLEDRIALNYNKAGNPNLLISPFFDLGAIWNNADSQNESPTEKFLSSVGLGLTWKPIPGLNTRLDYAIPLVDIKDRGDSLQDNGFHFRINYTTSKF
ncbi:MAG: ShlB/FhaC/HecB family hemolysin secretion/activation protein [Cyanobacteria bacterium P01_D01_bin.50]